MQDELLALERPAQAAFELEAADRLGVHVLREKLVLVAAFLLGAVICRLGILEQRLRLLAVQRIERDAQAGRDEHLLAVDRSRLPRDGEDALHDSHNIFRVSQSIQDDRELVAAEPGEHVLAAHSAFEALCHFQQDLVPDGVAEGVVVDDLEVVEIEAQHAHKVGAASRATARRAVALGTGCGWRDR